MFINRLLDRILRFSHMDQQSQKGKMSIYSWIDVERQNQILLSVGLVWQTRLKERALQQSGL